MLTLAIGLALAAECPAEPSLRDPDGEVTVLAQNLKFIITGEKRRERDRLFAEWLRGDGANVDLLLLSEARLTSGFDAWAPEWCFYTQRPDEAQDGYRWAPIASGRPPAGLALGVRQRGDGLSRSVGSFAGKRFRAKPTSLAEGFLGKLFHFQKGWAGLEIEDTHLVWSHAQASYRKDPAKGAGGGREGRAGQFADLAEDLGKPDRATLLTGDLNLLAGFAPKNAEDEPRVEQARARDAETVARFRERTGIDLAWPWARTAQAEAPRTTFVSTEAPAGAGAEGAAALAPGETIGTYAGDIDRRRADRAWDAGAPYDRVGVNEAFLEAHPGTRVRRVDIARGWLGVSDHLGLEISIPFGKRGPVELMAEAPREERTRACLFGEGPARGKAPRERAARAFEPNLRFDLDWSIRPGTPGDPDAPVGAVGFAPTGG